MDFPDLKNKHKQIGILEPMDDSCMIETRAGLTDSLANWEYGLSAFNFICSSNIIMDPGLFS